MTNPVYEVVSPIGDERDASAGARSTVGAPPLDVLDGKRLGLVWTEYYKGDTVLRAFRDHLTERYPHLECVEMPPGRGLRWGDLPDASVADLAREHGIDGAVVAAGC
jgi:hypothetical protein